MRKVRFGHKTVKITSGQKAQQPVAGPGREWKHDTKTAPQGVRAERERERESETANNPTRLSAPRLAAGTVPKRCHNVFAPPKKNKRNAT